RQDRRPAKVEPARDDHLRQSDWPGDPVANAVVRGIEAGSRVTATVLAAAAIACFVQNAGSKDVRVVCREDRPGDVARLAEARDARALRAWLDPPRWIPSEKQAGAVARGDVLPDVDGPGVRIDGRCGRADKSRRSVGIEEVRPGYQLNQPLNDGAGNPGALVVAEHQAVHVESLALPQSLVGREEKAPAGNDRPTKGSAG